MSLSPLVISEMDVYEAIQDLRISCAGPDDILPEEVKQNAEKLSGVLANLYNCSLKHNEIPRPWRTACIRPKYKDKDLNSIENPLCYRPIANTSCISKIMETVISRHIDKSFIKDGVMSINQHGYKQGRSATTNLLQTIDRCTEELDLGNAVDIIYLDISKMSETIPHRKLCDVLYSYGIRGDLLKWISLFIKDREQYVSVNGEWSRSQRVVSGIPQGSVLNNMLLAIFMNHIPRMVKCGVSIYCDDIKLYASVFNTLNQSSLARDLEAICQWFEQMGMTFSANKCGVLHLGVQNSLLDYYVRTCDGKVQLKKLDKQKDLGVYVDSNLSFTPHIDIITKEAHVKLDILEKQFQHLNVSVFMAQYERIIGKLETSTEVWSPSDRKTQDKIERVQERATSLITKYKHLSYLERLTKLERSTLRHRRLRRDIITFYKYYYNYYKQDKIFHPATNCSCQEEIKNSKAVKQSKNPSKWRRDFFFERTIAWWNRLPDEIICASNVDEFEKMLDYFFKTGDKYCYAFEQNITQKDITT